MSTSAPVEIEGFDAFGEILVGLERSFDAADYSDTFTGDAIPALLHSHRQNLDEQIDSTGEPWPALSPVTVAKKRKQGAPHPQHALWNWGSLRKSVLDIGDRYHIGEVQSREMTFGSDAHSWDKESGTWNPSAHLMQFGGFTEIGGNVVYVPPRPFIGVNEDVLGMIVNDVADHAAEEFDYKP